MAFDAAVELDGYRWWYLDALSEDGCQGLALIAFVGSVFSPYYAAARRSGAADPLDHCALNVALYGADGARWCMTERGRSALERSDSLLRIGPSRLECAGETLTIDIDEVAVPLPRRLRGTIKVRYPPLLDTAFDLDQAGRHQWQLYAPRADVLVDFEQPRLSWRGAGYLDGNHGDEPLERSFDAWQWSRTVGDPHTMVCFDTREVGGAVRSFALQFDEQGTIKDCFPAHFVRLGASGWGIGRATWCDRPGGATLERTLEDTPFYARSLISTQLDGASTLAVHESLALERFRTRWVQWLLPFRMPRARMHRRPAAR